MLPIVLQTLALTACIFIQAVSSLVLGWWFLLYSLGFIVSFYTYKDSKPHNSTWWLCAAWATALSVQTFMLAPTAGGSVFLWMLLGMPLLAISFPEDRLTLMTKIAFVIILVFALGLILQMQLSVVYTAYNNPGRWGWPLVDPNNAAALLNIAFIPCFYKMIRNTDWFPATGIFALAMYATGSKAGIVAALIGCTLVTASVYGPIIILAALLAGIAGATGLFFYHPETISNFDICWDSRLPIWISSWPLTYMRPWTGLGLGTFASYYATLRTETYTSGWHTHNDLLQLVIETGWPATLIFAGIFISIAATTRKANVVPACVILAVFMQSLVEFQFYIPGVSFPLGLAIAWHIHLAPKRSCYLSSTAPSRPVRLASLYRGFLKRRCSSV